jgi:hypothetical protein
MPITSVRSPSSRVRERKRQECSDLCMVGIVNKDRRHRRVIGKAKPYRRLTLINADQEIKISPRRRVAAEKKSKCWFNLL